MEPKKFSFKERSSFRQQFDARSKSHQIYVFGDEHYSDKVIEELKPIRLNEMMAPKLHTGNYLICRTISKAIKSIMVLVEDLDGNVETLQLKNLTKSELSTDLNDLLPEGTLLVIKEPYIKYGLNLNTPYICCDSPSDVLIIDETNELLNGTEWFKKYGQTEFEMFKSKGGISYENKNYESSLRDYRRASSIEPCNSVVNSDISAVLIKLERYQEALTHAHRSYILEPSDKAMFCMGVSAYGLRDWKMAIDCFKRVRNPNLCTEKIGECIERLGEAASASYNWLKMLQKSQNIRHSRLDVADFIGPVVAANITGKGKGLVATRPIEPGELLLVSKAFSSSYVSECDAILSSYNSITNQLNTPSEGLNMRNAMVNLKNNTDSASSLYDLFCGDPRNRYQKPQNTIVDTNRIVKICLLNAFMSDSAVDTVNDGLIGLWVFPALINHSCQANCYRTFYSDIMAVRSLRKIEENEEVTFEYIDVSSLSFQDRNKQLLEYYQFTCDCKLCETDKSDDQYEIRENLLSRFRDGHNMHLDQILTFILNLKMSFKKRKDLRFQLINPLSKLVAEYRSHRKYTEAIRIYEEILSITDGLLEDTSIATLFMMANAYYSMDDRISAKAALMKAAQKSKTVHGDCIFAFKIRFKTLDRAEELFKLI